MTKPLVLLVDEDRDTLEILELALTHAGYRVVATSDGQEGLELARRHEPDVVVGDFPMTVAGAARFSTALRCDDRFRTTPILSVTARAMAHELALTWSLADEVLLKPVRPAAVVAAVSRLLNGVAG